MAPLTLHIVMLAHATDTLRKRCEARKALSKTSYLILKIFDLFHRVHSFSSIGLLLLTFFFFTDAFDAVSLS